MQEKLIDADNYAKEIEQSLQSKESRIKAIYEKVEQRNQLMESDDTLILDITDDMYCGSMNPDMVSEFTCMLCYGIVIDPVKCRTCNTLVCMKCIDLKKFKNGQLECYKKCGARYPKILEDAAMTNME